MFSIQSKNAHIFLTINDQPIRSLTHKNMYQL